MTINCTSHIIAAGPATSIADLRACLMAHGKFFADARFGIRVVSDEPLDSLPACISATANGRSSGTYLHISYETEDGEPVEPGLIESALACAPDFDVKTVWYCYERDCGEETWYEAGRAARRRKHRYCNVYAAAWGERDWLFGDSKQECEQ